MLQSTKKDFKMWNKIVSFFKELFNSNSEQKQIEAYLAQSADIFELEVRMREVSRKKFI